MTDETAITQFLANPQKLLDYIHNTGDFEEGFNYVRVVYEVVSKFDATLDVVLKGMEEMWKPEEHAGQTFYQAAVQMTPLAPTTIQRHTRVGKMLDAVPSEFRPRIEQMDFKSKMYITGLVEDGVEVTAEEWGRIVEKPSYQGVAEEVRDVRGLAPRSQLCYFKSDDDGSIWVLTAQGLLKYAERVEYENEETRELMDWVHGKALRKLGATPK